MKKPIAVITGDVHLSVRQPECRTDDYKQALINKLKFVSEYVKANDLLWIDSGDLMDKATAGPEVIALTEHIKAPKGFYTIFGNHCMLYNMQNSGRTALNVVDKFHKDTTVLFDKNKSVQIEHKGLKLFLYGFNYGEMDLSHAREQIATLGTDVIKIAITHVMTYPVGQPPYPGCTHKDGAGLLEHFKDFDLIFSGDNHNPFTVKGENNFLINPGSLMRATAGQIDYKPKLNVLYDDLSMELIDIPLAEGVISREHIEKKKEKDAKIESFVNTLAENKEVSLSFQDNLKKLTDISDVSEEVNTIIEEVLKDE